MSDRTRKLIALRNRTDQDLLVLVNREIERGLALAELPGSRSSQLHAQAGRSYQTAKSLLPRISCLSESERARVEGLLQQLRSRLDSVPGFDRGGPLPASLAS